MINNNLVENWLVVYHGWALPLWKMMDFVNGKDDIPYMKWKYNILVSWNDYSQSMET